MKPALLLALAGGLAGLSPAQTTWLRRGNPPARYYHAMVYDSLRQRVVLCGGSAPVGFHTDTWVHRADGWTRIEAPHAPPPRVVTSLAYDTVRDRVVMVGGFDGGTSYFNDVWEFDGTDWAARTPTNGPLPSPRTEHALCYDPDHGETILFGGEGGNGTLFSDETWAWNGTAWQMKTPATRPQARIFHRMVWDASRHYILMTQGRGPGVTEFLSDTWRWDGTNWVDLQPAHSPPARAGATLAFDATRGRAVCSGGTDGNTTFTDTWEWDGTDWTQPQPATNTVPRVHGAAAFDIRGRVILHGGITTGGQALESTWDWNGTTWTEIHPQGPSARDGHKMAYDSVRQRIVMFGGGSTVNAPIGETWEWDGTCWHRMSPLTSPPARYNHAMAYDRARGRTVLFGGDNSSATNDETWEWDGTNWTIPPQSQPRPGPRFRHSMVYQPLTGTTLLFSGGSYGGAYFNDCWEWNGSTWSQWQLANLPIGRSLAAMTYDSRTGRTLLFGGEHNTPTGDFWEWDGRRWAQRPQQIPWPTVRLAAACAYDVGRMRAVLYGGFGGPENDTWEWDGQHWLPASPLVSPGPRRLAAMEYHAASGHCLLFGGWNGQPNDETWEYVSLAPASASPGQPGCPGSAGNPTLVPAAFGQPWIGWTYQAEVNALPTTTPLAVMLMGFSDATFGNTPLPLDLTPLQMPGCALRVSPELVFGVANLGGMARWSLPIADQRDLIGLQFFHQAVVPDPLANAAGMSLSNSLAVRIGAR